ncbi:hypothetical protein [Legionella septentrionalis]|uniref:Uncharacterized protein n=1 Tax=Legionella septentrionalis TaxID=2498109 RepID=A0A3S0V9Q0_9GAMM|nr:hypothetical protein [Legionella septentrionalis]RUQ81527.1 hypothetical protein EKM59_10580 [Legionella septentrionalis]
MMKMPEAYRRLNNDIEQYGETEAMERLIKGLRRLTTEYTEKKLEEIKVAIIKGDIFAYVYSSDYYPPYRKISEVTWGLELIINQAPPCADKLPAHKNGVYVLVQQQDETFSELYFVSYWNNPAITKINIQQNILNDLAKNLLPVDPDNDKKTSYELSQAQVLQIKKITGYILKITEAPGTWKEHACWQMLTPSDANIVISNKNHKSILNTGQQGFDIDDFWVVQYEANDLVAHIDDAQDATTPHFSRTEKNSTSNKIISKEDMYGNIKLSDEERKNLIHILQKESINTRNQFIQESVCFHIESLQKKYPSRKLERTQIIRVLHELHKPLYGLLKIEQPSVDSYISMERAQRSKQKLKS